MKKKYVSPEIKITNIAPEGYFLTMSDDWASGKKGFFDMDDEEDTRDKNLWGDDSLFGE